MLSKELLAADITALDLATPRLRLRALTPADDEVQIEHEANPTIMGYIRDPLPHAEIVQRVRDISGPWQAEEGTWVGLALEEKETQKITGFFFLRVACHESQSVELGYRLHPDYWGRGYAFEAGQHLLTHFKDTLQVRKVIAYCVSENAASAGLLSKMGFQREGLLAQHSALAGRWQDELVYGLVLAPERQAP